MVEWAADSCWNAAATKGYLMRIAMIGGGYVGLVSGGCFAAFGHAVAIVEADPAKLAALRARRMPIYEPGLAELVAEHGNRLVFTDSLADAVTGAEAVFIAVGTPTRRGDGHADLSYVFAAAEQVAKALTAPAVIVTKSTVPVGTGRRIARIVAEARPDLALDVASNPEFLREGNAITDFMRPDRVVVGCESAHAKAVLGRVYAAVSAPPVSAPVLFTRLETAELIKYAANAFLAMKVTFINEMADLAERVGADVGEIAHGIGLDARIGARFLQAGPGFGGSCFPKDTLALVRIAQEAGAPTRLIETVVAVNDARKAANAARVIAAMGGDVRGRTIAIWGLTFKAETDDMRDSPAIPLVARLEADGAHVRVFDPEGMEQARPLLPGPIAWCDGALAAAEGADALVVVTEWKQFREVDPAALARAMRGTLVVDLLDARALRDAGLDVRGVGRN
jgi:UDPglucose 6-dehydrogenase